MRRLLMLLALSTSALVAGCAGPGYTTVGVSGTYTTPSLAYVGAGVYVLEDWNEPVFYTNNLYWRYYNNNWYRSPYYNRGWVYSRPPRVLSGIDRPYAYVRYRSSDRYRAGRPIIRDHRRAPYYRRY